MSNLTDSMLLALILSELRGLRAEVKAMREQQVAPENRPSTKAPHDDDDDDDDDRGRYSETLRDACPGRR